MRLLGAGLADHIASGATTLCWCWKIVRRDGTELAFTDHDLEIVSEGQAFTPATGLDGSETGSRLGSQVTTAEVMGILDAEAITEADIVLGRYDGARVESWRVNWRNPDQRHLHRVDTIGEIVREDGVFRAELRSGHHALNVPRGRIYQHLCDARLGDRLCGIDLEDGAYRARAIVSTVADNRTVTVSGLTGFANDWFAMGLVRWDSGARAGVIDGIARQDGEVLTLDRTVGDWLAPGDALTIYAGCDKRFATCRDKFGNGVNFQGFPHIPGNDFVMRYPNSEDALDGRVLR